MVKMAATAEERLMARNYYREQDFEVKKFTQEGNRILATEEEKQLARGFYGSPVKKLSQAIMLRLNEIEQHSNRFDSPVKSYSERVQRQCDDLVHETMQKHNLSRVDAVIRISKTSKEGG